VALRNNLATFDSQQQCSHTAWDFSQDLGNLGVALGFGDFAMQSWDFHCHGERNILSEISPSYFS